MKKINYLLAFVALAFTACQKEPALHSVLPLAPGSTYQVLTLTLQKSDYQELPSSNYASTALSFKNGTDAQNGIAAILTSEYPNVANGSTAAVTYNQSITPTLSVADSLYADDAYTLTSADYLLLPGNKYTDFSVAQLLSWLPYKYPTPVANQLNVLTYNFYQSSVTPSAGTVTVGSALYLNNAWQYLYTLSAAQYTTLGRGVNGEIVAADNASLPQSFNVLLKADPTISDTIKTGDVVYVSYKYYASKAYQRVLPLVYNGTNYVTSTTITQTLNFKKTNGTWAYVQPLPVISHTLTTADITLISNSTVATAALRTNVGSYGDFSSSWTPGYLDAAFIVVLQADYPTPVINTIYEVVYKAYVNSSDVNTIASFQWNGTAWVAQQ
jgi:hypothetical protein